MGKMKMRANLRKIKKKNHIIVREKTREKKKS